MLLYVTTGEPESRRPQPLRTIPTTLTGLYDLGMREHARSFVLLHREGSGWQEVPDWRFDRFVIRLALFMRERLHVDAGERVAVLGPFDLLWLAADFAVQGLGAATVGLSHGLSDARVASALAETGARVAIATDAESARRLLRLRDSVPVRAAVIGPEEGPGTGTSAFHALWRALEMAATLDTAERAQSFRTAARAVGPDAEALWHFDAEAAGEGPGRTRLTHREAMALVRHRLLARPAGPGDLAYVEGTAAMLAIRLACYAFVGDGQTTTVLGRDSETTQNLPGLRPARLLASAPLIEDLGRRIEAAADGPLGRLSRRSSFHWLRPLAFRARGARRARERMLGDRLRLVEPLGRVSDATGDVFARAGIAVAAPEPAYQQSSDTPPAWSHPRAGRVWGDRRVPPAQRASEGFTPERAKDRRSS